MGRSEQPPELNGLGATNAVRSLREHTHGEMGLTIASGVCGSAPYQRDSLAGAA